MALTFKKIEPKQEDLIEKIEKVIEQNKNDKTEEKDDEVILAPEKEVEVEVEDASVALQKQIDALKKSEEIQRTRADQAERDRAAALQKVSERDTETVKLRKETFQSQFDAVSAALSGAQSEAESAKRDMRNALNAGDIDAQVEANERLAIARANISKLEDGKIELEERIKAAPEKIETVEKTHPEDKTPALVKDWVSRHPDYLQDQRKNDKIKALHWDAIDEGHAYGSPEYIDFIDIKCGFKQAPAKEELDDEEIPERQPQRTSIVSAPVSREAPSTLEKKRGGKINLTQEQREIAKLAGISEAEYGKQLMKINEMKANGSYGDRQ